MNFQGTGKRLSKGDVGKAARQIGIETAVLLSFLEVEAAGRGFDNSNRVKILPEAHIFYRHLKGAERTMAVSIGIAYRKWKRSYNFDKYKRFKQMLGIDDNAAFMSVSYGLGQIMGFNHKDAGNRTAEEMFETAKQGEYEQLVQLVSLMKAWGMHEMLKPGIDFTSPNSWRKAAKRYNGSGYERNQYHVKMAKAYVKHSGRSKHSEKAIRAVLKLGTKGEHVRNLQSDLQTLGYKFPTGVDGRFGRETDENVRKFQKSKSLAVDGVAGKNTLRFIAKELKQLEVDKSPELPEFDKQPDWLTLILSLLKGLLK